MGFFNVLFFNENIFSSVFTLKNSAKFLNKNFKFRLHYASFFMIAPLSSPVPVFVRE